jgi:ketosteroid isomerase-like protein
LAALSQADRETLRLFYEAVSRKDWDAVFRDVHPDFELKTPDRGLGSNTSRGREKASRALEDFFEPFEDVIQEPQEFFECNNQIVVFFLLRCRPRGSRATLEIRGGDLWTLRDGRAARLEIFPVREEALEAAGVAEEV